MAAIGIAIFFAGFGQSILAKSEAQKLSKFLAENSVFGSVFPGLRPDGSFSAFSQIISPEVVISDGLNRERITEGALFEASETVEDDLAGRTETTIYKVQPRDTLVSVARKFNISTDTIVWANGLKTRALKRGSSLVILPVSGVIHEIKSGETVESIADSYHVPAQQIYAFNKGKILTEGVELIVPGGQPLDNGLATQSSAKVN
ncbi:MAG: LysM peptidoglycan-binding domain-containing protein [Patescibacteria group bacterium]|nr:LysM peptidoglycan-binding domain-containing protein [Patescibacteria group bacterium]MCL5262152.1 LysM peptidoglycan-binding domain-containing protein [Patescibacteria group bacterium]